MMKKDINTQTDIVAIIPTYNERENISQFVEAIFNILPSIRILVVDDNSPDGTGGVVRDLQKKFSNLHLLARKQKEGLGKAYLNAFEEVLKDLDVKGIIMMDADFSHDPEYLPKMIEMRNNFDVIIGSRYVKDGGVIGWQWWRKALSYWGSFYSRIITRLPIADCTAGFYFINTDVLKKIDFSKIDASGYAFQIELKYFLWKSGAKMYELPIIFKNRINGESKITNYIIREGIVAPWKMILK